MIEFIQMIPLPVFLFLLAMPGLFLVVPALQALNQFKQLKTVNQNPVTLIAEKEEGPASIQGIVTPLLTSPLYATLTMRECCWFYYKIQQWEEDHSDEGGRWTTITDYFSGVPLLLMDKSGTCAIAPYGAQVSPAHRNLWYGLTPEPEPDNRDPADLGNEEPKQKAYRYVEERIEEGDHIYAMGHFSKGRWDDPEVEDADDAEDEEENEGYDKDTSLPPDIFYLTSAKTISSGSESDFTANLSQQANAALTVSLISAAAVVTLLLIRFGLIK